MSKRAGIWQVVIGDGTTSYFVDEAEAAYFAKDTVECGFSVRKQFLAMPATPREFVDFMDGLEIRLIRPARKLGAVGERLFDETE
jgi:hypothetical protein